jgi:CO/xanthine dehydrogenase Mo-binding subunit
MLSRARSRTPGGARACSTRCADADGRLVQMRARIVLDGGAYASSATAVCSNAACFAAGPYAVPNAHITAFVAYTSNPP